jgi:hypothetical protein
MKKLFPMITALCFALTACAGYVGHPVATSQGGDDALSCHALDDEIAYNHMRMDDLAPHTDKSGANTTMGVLGVALIVPLVFIDTKDGEKTEYDAYEKRNEHLKVIRADDNCPPDPATVHSNRLGYSFSDKSK